MSTIFRIALCNVLRHKRRALITAVTMIVGIAAFVAVGSIVGGLNSKAVDNLISLRDSSVKLFTEAYYADRESLPLDYGIPDARAVWEKLAQDTRITTVTPRTQFLATAGNYRDSLPVMGEVVDPAADPTVFSLTDYLAGGYFVPGPGSTRQVILGKQLADKLGLKLGDTVLIAARTRDDTQNADDFTIIGLLSTSEAALDKSTIFITYAAADDFLELEGLVTELDILVTHRMNVDEKIRHANAVAASIQKENPGLAARSFAQLDGGFLNATRQAAAWTYAIVLIVLLIAAVGIVNTVLMSVFERTREVGVLKALGFRGGEVVAMFALEGFFIGFLGSLLGAALGVILDALLVTFGLPFNSSSGLALSVGSGFSGRVYGEWNWGAVLFAALFSLVISLIAAMIPARRAARMSATSALHFA